jgi:hypothetical protein
MDKLFTSNAHKYTALRLVSGTLLMATAILVLQIDSQRSLAESVSFFSRPGKSIISYVMHLFGLILFCAALPMLSNSYIRKINTMLVIVPAGFILFCLFTGNFRSLIAGIMLLQLIIWLKTFHNPSCK